MPNHLSCDVEKNGKTLHLLKSGSKATQSGKTRKKVELLGSFDQYSESKKKPLVQNNVAAVSQNSGQIAGGSSILQFMAPNPSTKENANKGKDAKMSGK